MAAPPEAPRRRRLRGGALALIAAAVGAALIVIVVVLVSGGGGSSSESAEPLVPHSAAEGGDFGPLRYDRAHPQDEYDALAIMAIDGDEALWESYEITKEEFEEQWRPRSRSESGT